MSTDSNSEIAQRKRSQLEICVEPGSRAVEGGPGLFADIGFIHRALPEVDAASIDMSLDFLGCRIALPFLVSCMTGGSAGGGKLNRALAEAAQTAGIPVGLGSMRAFLLDEGLLDQFHVKDVAPDVPVIANLGAVQLREFGSTRVLAALERLEAQALAIHLNPGQELFQRGGDRDFRGLREAVAKLAETSRLPIIVKETGFGIAPTDVRWLLDVGVAYVDLAGSGGTNWILVEAHRRSEADWAEAEAFADWGLPTSALLLALGLRGDLRDKAQGRPSSLPGIAGRIIASGGLRSGVDLAKALALGAELGGFALPFARAAKREGAEGALRLIRGLEHSLRTVMVLTGAPNLTALRSVALRIEPTLAARAEELLRADSEAVRGDSSR